MRAPGGHRKGPAPASDDHRRINVLRDINGLSLPRYPRSQPEVVPLNQSCQSPSELAFIETQGTFGASIEKKAKESE